MNLDERIEKMEELNSLYDDHASALSDSEMSGDRSEANLIQVAIDLLVKALFK
ncbi:hypothetical protein MYO4S_00065 [Serratia phage 4S]|nr:hypothetical protein MYO4S_00065 [Serratia phage 4S]